MDYIYNIIIDKLQFQWDENKNQINKKKHKVSFEEASSVFSDKNALIIPDPDHSEKEDRFIILGLSDSSDLLVVCHCYRNEDSIIRLISARKATKNEASDYFKAV